MNPLKRTLALLIVAQVFCRTADGQQATLDSLKNARSYIRVTTGEDAAALGRISRLAADTLWLRFQREPVLIDEIAEIEVRTYHPDPLGNGGALGAGIGAFAGVLLTNVCPCEYPVGDKTLIWGGLFTGALVGLVVDLGRERADWKLVWSKSP